MDTLIEKLQNKARLDYEDGLKLYELDLFTLGKFANKIREEKNGKKVFFNINRHINPSNLCEDVCLFCAFSSHRKNDKAYTMSEDEIFEAIEQSYKIGAKELHIVSSHNPNISYEWFISLFKKIKDRYKDIHIKAMTAAEVDYIHRKTNISYEEILKTISEAGVDSMPGGGAEIFNEEIRKKLCPTKVSSKNWLKIHSLWHKMGKKSNATMLFGHIEDRASRIDHMIRLRDVQDKTGGFNAFIPLLFQRKNNFLKLKGELSSEEILKTYAISRILLDNIPHIKAYWATLGLNLALLAQNFGSDDLDGTIQKESIQSAAGANSKNGMKKDEFISFIKASEFIPVLRDSMYNEIKTY